MPFQIRSSGHSWPALDDRSVHEVPLEPDETVTDIGIILFVPPSFGFPFQNIGTALNFRSESRSNCV